MVRDGWQGGAIQGVGLCALIDYNILQPCGRLRGVDREKAGKLLSIYNENLWGPVSICHVPPRSGRSSSRHHKRELISVRDRGNRPGKKSSAPRREGGAGRGKGRLG